MATEQYINFLANTTLNGAINNSVTALAITPNSFSPSAPQFRIRIDDEMILVTAVAGGSNETYTITRGIESSVAASHSSGARVTYVLTAGGLNNILNPFPAAAIISVSSANAFVVGPNANTDPTLRIVTNIASAVTGISITGRAAGAGVDITALSSGSDEFISIVAKGTSSVRIPSKLSIGVGTGAPTYGLHLAPTSGLTAGQTVFIQDATASTGKTGVVIKAGAGDGISDHLLDLVDAAGNINTFFRTDGQNVMAALYGTNFDTFMCKSGTGFAVSSDMAYLFSSDGTPYGTPDLHLARSAASILKIGDGSSGYGTIDALAYKVSGAAGINATITAADLAGKTITVVKGIITVYA